jgi:arginase family enzyme
MAHTGTVSIVGAAAALRPRGALGLLWIDAHMDAHRPHTSPSGNLYGMPRACLLGHGEPALATLAGAPALAPAHVCLVGGCAGAARGLKRLRRRR